MQMTPQAMTGLVLGNGLNKHQSKMMKREKELAVKHVLDEQVQKHKDQEKAEKQ